MEFGLIKPKAYIQVGNKINNILFFYPQDKAF
jgi:hypothetical protein